jgi:hypothetical protein
MQSANFALSIRDWECSITQQAYLESSHNTTLKPENLKSLMALNCVVYLFIVLFCVANCIRGIDDMIMDFKFCIANEVAHFLFDTDSSLILQYHYHPLLIAEKLSSVMGKFSITPAVHYARIKAHKVPTAPLVSTLATLAAVNCSFFTQNTTNRKRPQIPRYNYKVFYKQIFTVSISNAEQRVSYSTDLN